MLSRRVVFPTAILFCAAFIATVLYGATGGLGAYFYNNTKIPRDPPQMRAPGR